jgi:hypothetical protein
MIENDILLNYGVLGLWTISLLYEKFHTQKKLGNVIRDNTKAIRELKEKIKK